MFITLDFCNTYLNRISEELLLFSWFENNEVIYILIVCSFFIQLIISKLLLSCKNILAMLSFKQNVLDTLMFTFKFLILIALLVFVRGGIPRYRYDFLTKIGWFKFLSLILSVFLFTVLMVYLM